MLVLVAARAGLPIMEKWHDPTGIALQVGCFICLWLVALELARKNSTRHPPLPGPQTLNAELLTPHSALPLSVLASGLVVWAIAVAVSTEAWFRSHEVQNDQALTWTPQWPESNTTLRTNTIPRNSQRILRCDDNSSAKWSDADGFIWQAFFLRWYQSDSFYGRARVALSVGHNPAACLTGAGMKLRLRLEPVQLPAGAGRSLWFDRYIFTADGRDLFVFFSQTEQMTGKDQLRLRATRLARLRQTLAGSRNFGQNIFEVALAGPESAAAALQVFSRQLPELIRAQPGSR